jgi:hypothetical protein
VLGKMHLDVGFGGSRALTDFNMFLVVYSQCFLGFPRTNSSIKEWSLNSVYLSGNWVLNLTKGFKRWLLFVDFLLQRFCTTLRNAIFAHIPPRILSHPHVLLIRPRQSRVDSAVRLIPDNKIINLNISWWNNKDVFILWADAESWVFRYHQDVVEVQGGWIERLLLTAMA